MIFKHGCSFCYVEFQQDSLQIVKTQPQCAHINLCLSVCVSVCVSVCLSVCPQGHRVSCLLVPACPLLTLTTEFGKCFTYSEIQRKISTEYYAAKCSVWFHHNMTSNVDLVQMYRLQFIKMFCQTGGSAAGPYVCPSSWNHLPSTDTSFNPEMSNLAGQAVVMWKLPSYGHH